MVVDTMVFAYALLGVPRFECDFWLELYVGWPLAISKEAPTCYFEQLIDFDSSGGFFHCLVNWRVKIYVVVLIHALRS